jgi:hypothetical protein
VTDPSPTVEHEQPPPVTDAVAEESSAPVASQEDSSVQLTAVLDDHAHSQPEDRAEISTLQVAQTYEDQQTEGQPVISAAVTSIPGPVPVEKSTEAPPNGSEQSEAHPDVLKVTDSAKHPLIEQPHDPQDQKPIGSADGGAQSCDTTSSAEVPNEVLIDTPDPELQSKILISRCPTMQIP